jgi:hypothetical protein
MALVERSYSGQIFRPRPEIHMEGNGQLLIIATPWGPRSSAKKAIQIIQDYFLSSQQDREATSPFAKLTCLSPLANDLRIAIKLANDSIYNEENKNEFISGLELMALARNENEAVWAQIGYPYVLLDRPQHSLLPLGTQQDMSIELTRGPKAMAPLPHKLLGLDKTSDFAIESFRSTQHDRFIFVSRSGLPPDVQKLSPAERNLDSISQLLAQDDADLPFWLGLFDMGPNL